MEFPKEKASESEAEVENLVAKTELKTTENVNRKKGFKQYLGFPLAIASALFLSLANTFARKALLFGGSEIALLSYVITLFTMLVVIWWRGENPLGPNGNRRLTLIRSVIIIMAIVSMKCSVKLISPSDATALFHTNVIIVAVIARFIFKEMLGFIHILCLFLAITGFFYFEIKIFNI